MNNSFRQLRSANSRSLPVIFVSIGAILVIVIIVVVTIAPGLFTPQKTATSTMTERTTPVVADSPQLFGSNLVYLSGQTQQLTSPSTYTLLQQLHIQFLRIPILSTTDTTTLTSIEQKVHALNITPVVVLRGPSFPQALASNEQLVQTTTKIFGTSTVYYEYGSDDDVLVSASNYVSSWNSTIPQLKKLAPTGKFLGPATSQYNHATLATFLQQAKPAPDAISWHEFPCTADSSQTSCLQGLNNWTSHISDARQIMHTTVHKALPIMITEWNYAANASPTDGKSNNRAFLTSWTTQAFNTLAKNYVFAAMQYASNATTTALINQQNQLTIQGDIFKTQYEQHVLQVKQEPPQPTATSKSKVPAKPTVKPTPTKAPTAVPTKSPTSPPVQNPVPPIATSPPAPPPVQHVTIVDNLNDWSDIYSHTGNLNFDCDNSSHMNGDSCALYRLSNTSESVTWHLQGMTSFQATTYILSGEPVDAVGIYASQNGSSWTAVSPSSAFVMGQGGTWSTNTYTLSGLSNVNYVKVVFPITGDGDFYTPQIGKVVYSN